MATEQRLTLHQGNDESVEVWVVARLDAEPYDLDGATVQLVMKASASMADTDPEVTVLSTATGEVEITDPGAGQIRVHITRDRLQRSGLRWWRLDVVRPGARRTAVYGDLYVVDM